MADLMGRFNLNEWKKWVETDLSKNLKSTLTTYEKKVQGLASDLELKGKEARKKGEVHLDKWVKNLKKSRADVEKRVSTLVNAEAVKLSKSFSEMLKNLRAAAKSAAPEVVKAKPSKGTAKKKASKSQAPESAAVKGRKPKVRTKAKNGTSRLAKRISDSLTGSPSSLSH